MENDTIKCGRITYNLVDGDTIMDNGACFQLITRTISKGWDRSSPRVSKTAFKKFIDNPNVQLVLKHRYSDHIKLYKYNK